MINENNSQSKNQSEKPKVLRTYSSDMADSVRTNEASVIKIALAEKMKKERNIIYQTAKGTPMKRVFLIIAGIILIISAILGSNFAIKKKKEKNIPQITTREIESFISYNNKSFIDTTGSLSFTDIYDSIKSEINKMNNEPGLVKAIFLTKTIEKESVLLSLKDFLSLIRITAPSSLVWSLSNQYMIGIYSPTKNVNPPSVNEKKSYLFLIFQTTDYNLTYASMLEWEKTMLGDMFTLFNIDISLDNRKLLEKPWKDIIINNRDVRVLYNNEGIGILYYIFVGKNNFIITNNSETIKEIVSRLIVKNIKPL